MSGKAYEDIMNLRGYEDFKALAKRLCQLAQSRRDLSGVQAPVPNFLFVEDPGAGVTTQLKLLTRLLMEQKLIRFMGERRYFEWALDDDAFEKGGSFDRLLQETDAAAGFYSQFRGVIGIELGEWSSWPRHPGFRRLLDFAADMYRRVTFVFVTEERDAEKLARLHRVLNEATPIEMIRCPLPKAEDMTQYLLDFLWERGFAAAEKTEAAIAEFMPELMKTEDFDGMQTMSILADEIVFHACSSAGGVQLASATADGKERVQTVPVVRPEHLSFITGEKGYISRHARRQAKQKKIGFERVG